MQLQTPKNAKMRAISKGFRWLAASVLVVGYLSGRERMMVCPHLRNAHSRTWRVAPTARFSRAPSQTLMSFTQANNRRMLRYFTLLLCVVAVAAIGWALVAGPGTVYRIIVYNFSGIADYRIFPRRGLSAVPAPFRFPESATKANGAIAVSAGGCGHDRTRRRYASKTAMMPVMNIPSNVPAPPMEAIGSPILRTSLRRSRSAPISTPSVPQT